MTKTCVLILDNIRSVENTGSIFRTADGLGVAKIYLVGTTPAPLDRFGRKRADFAKVSLGAEDTMPWEQAASTLEVVAELKHEGFQIIALEQSESSASLNDFESREMFALIVGNEVEGISREILDQCDDTVEIEMRGHKESLNVAVATGIALFTLL